MGQLCSYRWPAIRVLVAPSQWALASAWASRSIDTQVAVGPQEGAGEGLASMSPGCPLYSEPEKTGGTEASFSL